MTRYYQALIGFAFAAALAFLTVLCVAGCERETAAMGFDELFRWRLLQIVAVGVTLAGIAGLTSHGIHHKSGRIVCASLVAVVLGATVVVTTLEWLR